MIFNTTNTKDIQRYYMGTLIKLKESGDTLWKVIEVSGKEVTLRDSDGFTASIDLNYDYEVDFFLPSRVVYQQGNRAALIWRKPSRQYYRGIHPENTGISVLTKAGEWATGSCSHVTLNQYVNKPCYQDITTVNWDEYESAALNPYFAVTRAGMLYALNKHIGKVHFDAKAVQAPKMLRPELTVLFPNYNFL